MKTDDSSILLCFVRFRNASVNNSYCVCCNYKGKFEGANAMLLCCNMHRC